MSKLWLFECGHAIPTPWGMVRPAVEAVGLAHEKECPHYAEVMKRVRTDSLQAAARRFRESHPDWQVV